MAGIEIYRAALDELPSCQCDPKADEPCGPGSDCLNRILMYECHPAVCPAGERCRNQCFQRREDPELESFFTGNRGWGVRTKVDLKKVENIG
jgi:histone-lysine N-methyltransferase NSD2